MTHPTYRPEYTLADLCAKTKADLMVAGQLQRGEVKPVPQNKKHYER
jgi:hypothetical protein